MSPSSLPQRVGCECCGQFKGSLVGSHSFTFPDGSTYKGEWANGTVEGRGTYTWSSGTKYVGQFKAGVPHGEGELVFTDGTLYKGVLSEGQIGGGEGEVQFRPGLEGAKGSRFEGGFEEAAANGRGVFRYPNSPAEGAWARGRFTSQQHASSTEKSVANRRPRSKDKGMTGVSAASFSLIKPDQLLTPHMGSIKQRRSLSKSTTEGKEEMLHGLNDALEASLEEPIIPPTPDSLSSKGPLRLQPQAPEDPANQDLVDGPDLDQDSAAAEPDA